MVFSGLPFIFMFFAVTLLVYKLVPKKVKNLVLFISSLFFYGYGEPVYIFLMLFSITMNFVCGLLIGKFSDNQKKKKAVLIICVILNISLLGFFKYSGLVVDSLKALPVFSFLPNPDIALPIGISFYTFQTMSYVIDAYWGNCAPQKNYINFGTYVALFPQLIAGPIVRYVDIENQLQNRKESPELFYNGVKLFIIGLAKKVLIANQLGSLWDQFKIGGAENGILGSWFGIISFTLQIYFDFSGYSDMACGLGNMFGFNFVKNFNYPYVSVSITEFWRRWHISLGTWFREYVYIPLGGNRKGKGRLILNLLIVWGLTGIWHGASWNFLLWGLYFGVILIIEKFGLLKILEKIPKFFSHIYALFFIVLGWVIFEFTDLSEMGNYIANMFTANNGLISSDMGSVLISHLPLLAISILACLPLGKNIASKCNNTKSYKAFEFIFAVILLILSVASLVNSTYNQFLYFRL
ncbi:MAG: MBOAT family protein [Ruminococcus sp.]|nr:MBOAT family protein [Candidatus Copronaster equi]